MARTTLRSKGQITLPPEVRAALHVEDGDEIEFEVTDTGAVVMRGLKMIAADQAWFWSDDWQRGELEASEQIAAGSGEVFQSSGDFLDSFKR
ncbi:MAG: AbrB/MazE/SpoVT family DNA-binding domain-containing protein [Pseudonocardiales bacterium]|nr:AbrB/MazE/SpoVT family DNA-binding domain-containing protein [Pseudonocardiales bacterium]